MYEIRERPNWVHNQLYAIRKLSRNGIVLGWKSFHYMTHIQRWLNDKWWLSNIGRNRRNHYLNVSKQTYITLANNWLDLNFNKLQWKITKISPALVCQLSYHRLWLINTLYHVSDDASFFTIYSIMSTIST